MKIYMECPNCKAKSTLQIPGQKLSSQSMKSFFKGSNTFCMPCYKGGVGRIELKIVNFDWEKICEPKSTSQVPTKLDITELSEEERARIKNREKEFND